MVDESAEHRRYSDEETALILRRAAELQETGGRSRHAAGFTLAEIQQIASEAGIDPACITEAAALVSAHERDRWAGLLGAPTRFRFERVVSGELPERAWGALVEEIREAMQRPGQVGHVAGALEWVHESGDRDWVRIGVTSRSGKTHIDLRARRGDEAAGVLSLSAVSGAMLALLTGGLLGLEATAGVFAVLGGGSGAGLAFGWATWKRLSAGWERRLSTLVTRLARMAEEASDSEQEHTRSLPAAHRTQPPAS